MFAVIKTGGKQYRVTPGDVLTVEKLTGSNGDSVDFTDVLMVSDGKSTQIGLPLVAGAVVKTRIINQERADKIIIFKKKRRHNYRRKNGHRQYVTALQVVEIAAQGISGKAEKLVQPKPVASVEAASTKVKTSQAGQKPAQKSAPKAAAKSSKSEVEAPAKAAKPAAKAVAEKAESKTAKAPAKAKKPAAAKEE